MIVPIVSTMAIMTEVGILDMTVTTRTRRAVNASWTIGMCRIVTISTQRVGLIFPQIVRCQTFLIDIIAKE